MLSCALCGQKNAPIVNQYKRELNTVPVAIVQLHEILKQHVELKNLEVAPYCIGYGELTLAQFHELKPRYHEKCLSKRKKKCTNLKPNIVSGETSSLSGDTTSITEEAPVDMDGSTDDSFVSPPRKSRRSIIASPSSGNMYTKVYKKQPGNARPVYIEGTCVLCRQSEEQSTSHESNELVSATERVLSMAVDILERCGKEQVIF